MPQACGNRSREAITHRAARRRQLRMKLPVRKEPVYPDGEIAGAVREDRVCGKLCRQMPNDDRQVDAATRPVLRYLNELLVLAPRRFGRRGPARSNRLDFDEPDCGCGG